MKFYIITTFDLMFSSRLKVGFICSGARVVISHPQGRQMVEEQQKQYPDVVVSNLPEKMLLQNVAAHHSFEVVKFVDEPAFYLAILKFINQ